MKTATKTYVPTLCACCAWLRIVGMERPRLPRECPVDHGPCALLMSPTPDGGLSADAVLAACAEGRRQYRDERDAFVVRSIQLAVLMPDVMEALVASGWPDLP